MPKGIKGFQKGHIDFSKNKGRKHTEEYKKKISERMKDRRVSIKTEFKKGHKGYWKDKKFSKEYKNKLSISHKLSKRQRGYNHYKYKGTERWLSKQAKIRDDYTCQICSFRDLEIMEIDHIKPKSTHPELVKNIENMMTLCPNCHRRKTIREKKEIFKIKQWKTW